MPQLEDLLNGIATSLPQQHDPCIANVIPSVMTVTDTVEIAI